MHKHIYRNQVWDASDCSGTLMLEPCRESFSSLLSYNGYSLILSFFFFPRGRWDLGYKDRLVPNPGWSWLPIGPGKLCQGPPSALYHSMGELWWGRVGEKRKEGRWELCSLETFPFHLRADKMYLVIPYSLKGHEVSPSFWSDHMCSLTHLASSTSRQTQIPRLPARLVPKIKFVIYCKSIIYLE